MHSRREDIAQPDEEQADSLSQIDLASLEALLQP